MEQNKASDFIGNGQIINHSLFVHFHDLLFILKNFLFSTYYWGAQFTNCAFCFEILLRPAIVQNIQSNDVVSTCRDHISRITSRIDDSLPDMYRLLGETNKRQTTFYRSYEQVLSLYKILSKTNKHSKTIGPLCEEAETKLAKILTDRSAEEVIKKVCQQMIFLIRLILI